MSKRTRKPPVLMHKLDASQFPPYGAILVENPAGTARLKTLDGPYSIPATGMIREAHEVFLVLDDIPLVRRHVTDCPTCLQLLQIGCGSVSKAIAFADAIGGLTVAQVRGTETDWVEHLYPIIELLPPGYYLVHLADYYPTDGSGKFFWNSFDALRLCEGLSYHCWVTNERPAFLMPTQPTRCFRPESFAAAQDNFRDKPGLAIPLSGSTAALLDGHHRALAAARNHETFSCITLEHLYSPKDQLHHAWPRLPRSLKTTLVDQRYDWTIYRNEISQAETDSLVAQVESVEKVPLPEHLVPNDLDQVFPGLEAKLGLEVFASDQRYIRDDEIDAVLLEVRSGAETPDWEHVSWLLNTLFGNGDTRSIAVAKRVASDFQFRECWAHAFKLLATRRCDEVDDFFVEFLIADGDPPRPELRVIVDRYFANVPSG